MAVGSSLELYSRGNRFFEETAAAEPPAKLDSGLPAALHALHAAVSKAAEARAADAAQWAVQKPELAYCVVDDPQAGSAAGQHAAAAAAAARNPFGRKQGVATSLQDAAAVFDLNTFIGN